MDETLRLIEEGRGGEVEGALRAGKGLYERCVYAVYLASVGREDDATAALAAMLDESPNVHTTLLLSNAVNAACLGRGAATDGSACEGHAELAAMCYAAHVGSASPASLQVCARIADCCFYLGRHDGRERLIEPIARLPSVGETARVDIGECKLLAGRYEDASAYFRQLLADTVPLSAKGKATCGVSFASALACRHLFPQAVSVLEGLGRSDLAERVATYAPIATDVQVALVGLRQQDKYNGVNGYVEQFVASGRYAVRLECGSTVHVRPENIRPRHVQLSSRRPVVVSAA
jgi:hypothetical protein